MIRMSSPPATRNISTEIAKKARMLFAEPRRDDQRDENV